MKNIFLTWNYKEKWRGIYPSIKTANNPFISGWGRTKKTRRLIRLPLRSAGFERICAIGRSGWLIISSRLIKQITQQQKAWDKNKRENAKIVEADMIRENVNDQILREKLQKSTLNFFFGDYSHQKPCWIASTKSAKMDIYFLQIFLKFTKKLFIIGKISIII